MRCARRSNSAGFTAGFTLIELLIALLILGVMSALGYNTYRAARISAEHSEDSLKRTREIEFGLRVMVQDFAEAVPRPVRDPLGESRLPSLRGGTGSSTLAGGTATATLVELTRAGWSNTAGMQRSTLQRVSYQLVGTVLQRSYQSVLDATSSSQPIVQNLLSDVSSVQLNYMDGGQNWVTQWPPPTLPQPQNLWTRPLAVEIIIVFKDWGRVRRLVEVAG
jgi:general secretion pathway protein J